MNGIFGLITPLLLHMVISECVVVFLNGLLDTAWCTTIAAILVLPAAFWMLKKEKRNFAEEKKDEACEAVHLKLLILCFLGGGILNLLWSGMMNLLHITKAFSNQTQEMLLAGQILVQIIGLGVLVPLSEELIFRGLIYRRMRKWFPAVVSVLLSALLFAVYHGNPIQMIYAFPMAAVLAVIVERGRHLAYPVMFHMGANLTAVFLNMFLS